MFGWRDNVHTNRPHVIIMPFYYNDGVVAKNDSSELKYIKKNFKSLDKLILQQWTWPGVDI